MFLYKTFVGLFLAGLFLCGVSCAPRPATNADHFLTTEETKTSNSIINGTPINYNNPISRSVVAIYDNQRKSICTGSLLPNNIILTAAHCLNPDVRYLYVIFEIDFSNPAKIRQYKMAQVIAAMTSPTWKNQEYFFKDQGDIGLLKFAGQVPNGYIPVTLLADHSVLKKGTSIVIAGYGINNNKNFSGGQVLRQATVSLLDPQFSNLEMLAEQTQNKGACLGDSGGPAFVLANGRYYLWGVINRGYDIEGEARRKQQAAKPEVPSTKKPGNSPVSSISENRCDKQGVYTRIDVFSAWIQIASTKMANLRP